MLNYRGKEERRNISGIDKDFENIIYYLDKNGENTRYFDDIIRNLINNREKTLTDNQKKLVTKCMTKYMMECMTRYTMNQKNKRK